MSQSDRSIQLRVEREEAEYAASQRRSNEQRIADERRRRLERCLAAPAVLGVIGLIYWITRSMPVEQWYVFIVSVFLMIPYWTIKYGMED
jgi:hypothetical protein